MNEAKLQEILDDAAERLALGRYSNADASVHALVAEVRRLTAALATARREGAEEMRAAAVAACEGVAKQHQRTREGHRPYVADSTRQWVEGIEKGADLCACFLRALPLDAPGGAT